MDGIANENGDECLEVGGSSSSVGIEPKDEIDEVMREAEHLKFPPIPSVEEYKKHKLTHVPFKPWCPTCVKAQAQNPPHKRLHHEREFPSFHMD